MSKTPPNGGRVCGGSSGAAVASAGRRPNFAPLPPLCVCVSVCVVSNAAGSLNVTSRRADAAGDSASDGSATRDDDDSAVLIAARTVAAACRRVEQRVATESHGSAVYTAEKNTKRYRPRRRYWSRCGRRSSGRGPRAAPATRRSASRRDAPSRQRRPRRAAPAACAAPATGTRRRRRWPRRTTSA